MKRMRIIAEMNNSESPSPAESKLEVDYNLMVYKSIHILHNSVKNLKFFLDNDLQQEEWEKDRNDKIRYSILDDLEELVRYLNNSDMIPSYNLELVLSPRFSKDDLR